MRLRTLYALAGLVLGALAAVAVAFQAFALAAGVSWLFLFGDDAWPAGVEAYLLGVPLAAGVLTLIAGVGLGYAVGRRGEASARPERARRRGHRLLAAGAVLWLLVLALGVAQHERQSAARATAAHEEAAFHQLQRARHVITGLRGLDAGADELRLSVGLAGRRSGAYRLAWRLDEPLYGITLLSGERRLVLAPESSEVTLSFETAALAERYRNTVLEGRDERVLVEGAFRLRLSLLPLLDEAERRALPAREIGNIERGLSELGSETDLEVPVSLDLTVR